MTARRTLVCRTDSCPSGGWWGDVPARCPRCGGRLTELPPTLVLPLRSQP